MSSLVHSGQEAVVPTAQASKPAATGWEPGGEHVKAAVRRLTRAERRAVAAGYIGSERMDTVRNLKRKGMFYHHITSPNGRCGPMKLTVLGMNARQLINARAHKTGEAA